MKIYKKQVSFAKCGVLFLFFILLHAQSFAQRVGNGGNFNRQELNLFLSNLSEVLQLGAFAHQQQNLLPILMSNPETYDLNAEIFRSIGPSLILLRRSTSSNVSNTNLQFCIVSSTQTIDKVLVGESISSSLQNFVFFDSLPQGRKESLARDFDKAKLISPTVLVEGRAYEVSLISSSCLYEF